MKDKQQRLEVFALLCGKARKPMAEHFPAPWHVDPLTASIYATDVPKGPARVADMRGWGYLTGKGHGALALSQDEAIDIQRANAAFLVKAVNNHDALVKHLHHLATVCCDEDTLRLLDSLTDAAGSETP